MEGTKKDLSKKVDQTIITVWQCMSGYAKITAGFNNLHFLNKFKDPH